MRERCGGVLDFDEFVWCLASGLVLCLLALFIFSTTPYCESVAAFHLFSWCLRILEGIPCMSSRLA